MTLLQEFQSLICKEGSLYIYGSGSVGKKIFSVIDFLGMSNRVKSFLVSDLKHAGGTYLGIPIVWIENFFDRDGFILVSVTEVYYSDVIKKLNSLGISNYADAFKYEFIDVEKAENVVDIQLRNLVRKVFQKDDFVHLDIVIRLLAVENFYKKNDYGLVLYKKLMDFLMPTYFKANSLSDLWLPRFKKLVVSVEKDGFYADSEIVVSQNFLVRNGRHRLALAIFHSIPKIKIRQCFYDGEECFFPETAYKEFFSEHEMSLIKNRLNKLKNGYGI